jgi:HlyD family secretion protein
MGYTIEKLEDIKDSREIMEARPHKFGLIFIYILLALIITAVGWSYFSEKEIVVKATGMIRPNNEIVKVSNKVPGKVVEIKYKDGDKIKKDDVMYIIEHDELKLQKKSYEKAMDVKEKELLNWERLLKDINEGKNSFNKDIPEEREFYSKYKNYEDNIKESNNQKEGTEKAIDILKTTVTNLNKLQKSIEESKNNLEEGSSYYYQYIDYTYNIDSLNKKLEQAQKSKDELVKNKATEEQIKASEELIQQCSKEIEKYKNSSIMNIKSNVEQAENKIKESNANLNNSASIEKFNSSTLININDNINLFKDKISDLKLNVEAINKKIEDCIVKSPTEGVINTISSVKLGDFIQSGVEVSSILPENSDIFKLDIFIDNKDIGNIKEGQSIKCSFLSLSQKDYGAVDSTITNISPDSKVDSQKGTSYYTAGGSISYNYLENRKGEKAEIKPGMIFQAQIINRRVKYLYYFLEKISLKD